MPSKPTTRWQISGYNFLVRRMEHALVRRDVRMLHDPMRSQVRAYVVGLVLAVMVLAGCGVLALLRPQDLELDDGLVSPRDHDLLAAERGVDEFGESSLRLGDVHAGHDDAA